MTTTGVRTVNGVADGRRMMTRDLIFVVGTVSVTGIGIGQRPSRRRSGKTGCGRAVLDARRHPLVTVEADQVQVESRLTAGEVGCPGCPGVLAPWGWARRRGVRGVGSLRPRRARCGGCLVTHVLLPVPGVLRRADAVEVIGAALTARAAGLGHRRIAVWLGVPAGTPSQTAIRRCPRPAARAVSAAPMTSTASARRSTPGTGNNTCVTRHPPHRARRGRNEPTPRTPRRRAHPHGANTPGQPGQPTSPAVSRDST